MRDRIRFAARGMAVALRVALGLSTGCTGVAAVRFSSPRYPGARTEPFAWFEARPLRAPTENAIITVVAGLDVSVQASNGQPRDIAGGLIVPFVPWPPGIVGLLRPSPAPPPLRIWLNIGPVAAAQFDVARVLVIDSDGAVSGPTAVVGEACRWCNVTSTLPVLPIAPVYIERSAALVLSFPVPASPERPFTLRVDGLTRQGTSLPAFDVRFDPATAWVLFWGI
ncbi:MAG TPA: hypothetical protein VKU61_10460 [Candidatus Binatia bacterium]|nr:hypothetical protein [Candidatus Binatia bacterium]